MVMNRLLYILLLAMALTGCEIIPEQQRLIPLPMQADTIGGAHLLMEFTGFRCVNCPTAAATAEALHQTYGNRLVIVAMHPASNPFTQGKYDYTCEAADYYYKQFGGVASTPFPTVNIDGLPTADGYLYDYSEWPTVLVEQMKRTTYVHLSAQARLQDNQVTITATCYADNPREAVMHRWLVEDSICGAQAMPDGSVNTAYYHRHVLRDVYSDPQGEMVQLRNVPAEHTATMSLPEGCEPRHCVVVVVLADKEDGQVLNVTQTRLL